MLFTDPNYPSIIQIIQIIHKLLLNIPQLVILIHQIPIQIDQKSKTFMYTYHMACNCVLTP